MVFILRCFILWAYFGLNIVLLVPTGKFDDIPFAREFIRPAVREVCLAPVSFRGFNYAQTLSCRLSLIYFIQPNLTDVIAVRHGELK